MARLVGSRPQTTACQHFKRYISELEKRGLVEIRFFSGERGRGGRILKMRPAYEKEIIKRYVDRLVMKK